MFDVFYCRKASDLASTFHTTIMPKELVHMYIIDTKQLEPLKNQQLCDLAEGKMAVNHFKKHQQFIFNLAAPAEELTKFVEGYLDDKLNTHMVTLDRE